VALETGQASLHLNLPGYAQLRERLMPTSERLGISDAAPEHLHRVESGVSDQQSDGALLVAIELDDQRPWPPPLPKNVSNAGILDSRESRTNCSNNSAVSRLRAWPSPAIHGVRRIAAAWR
jgi:hypothetical protein